ncbi:hypothetical protein HF313_19465 [Massilia atriviolacea]|uniref:Uncharacterized protein n=1 Tax=Massilia atriviolacea TaxID=2495579 RepID=A0A430HSL8_9BURK|nr:hypothetical protein [Massilia atriviolacea]RSZ60516.1 hypothetical protein EJB06_05235 [Massilia atriviolacea]
MTVNIFDLPDPLVAHVVQVTAYGQNTQTANVLLEMAKPALPPANATLSQEQLTLIMSMIDTHFDSATNIATQWEVGNALLSSSAVKDLVQDTVLAFSRFARHMDQEYGTLIACAYNKDEAGVLNELTRFKGLLEEILAGVKGAATSVSDYESALGAALAAFNKDFDRVLAEVGTVSTVIGSLQAKVASLQDNIAENNAAVLDTFIDTAGTEIEQGVTLAGAAAEENVGGVVSAGVQMGVAYVKGLVKVIELNDKTLQDLLDIRTLGTQIGQDEVILVTLLNIGTMLSSLGATQGLQLNVVGDVIGYFTQLDQDIDTLLKQHTGNLAAQIDTSNYSPATVGAENPAFPPWNVLAPVDRAARVFDKVMSLQATTFDDSTEFAALGSNAAGNR